MVSLYFLFIVVLGFFLVVFGLMMYAYYSPKYEASTRLAVDSVALKSLKAENSAHNMANHKSR